MVSDTSQPSSSKAVQLVSTLIQESGGLQGLMSTFEQHGLGGVMKSWIGNGTNQQLTQDEFGKLLNSDQLQPVLVKLGLTAEQAQQQLAAVLPQIIDRLTPDGQVSENHFTLSSLISAGESILKH